MRGLADLDHPDPSFRHKPAQVDAAQIDERHDRRPAHHNFSGLGRARHDGPVERRPDDEVLPVGLGLGELRARLLGLGRRAGHFGILLRDLLPHRRRLGASDVRIRQVGPGRRQGALQRVDALLGGTDRRGLLFRGRRRLFALPFGRTGLSQTRVGLLVEQSELIGRLLLGELRFGRRQIGFRLADST